jgi:acetyltransferase-like isoleucine patch superfamily enzyme
MLYYFLQGKRIVADPRVVIVGFKRIETDGILQIGLSGAGFMGNKDRTILRVGGRLKVGSRFWIGKGCRIAVGSKAELVFSGNGYINSNTTIVAMNRIEIGRGCAISWNVQLVDDDFHTLKYEGRVLRSGGIVIGDNVWICCNAVILNGSRIPRGSVVAAGAVVSSAFSEENVLIAGNPARIVKREIMWEK